jgi:hypothetical protein
MNSSRSDLKSKSAPELTFRVAYPSLSRSFVDSMMILGRTTLISGAGAAVLLGAAIVIAYVLSGALGLLGYDGSTSY